MNEKHERIPIFFAIDDGYAPFLSVALASIIQNASREYMYKITVLHQNLSKTNQERLAALGAEHVEIQFVPMENRLEGITDRIGNRLRADFFTLTIFFRLFIPVMFPEYDKAIYLDSDVVVPGDISELYRTELGDHLLAAAADHSVAGVPPFVDYIENGVGVKKDQYINSGVLLMNLKKMRESRLEHRVLELMDTYHFDCIAPDQDYLNVLCNDRIVYLPPFWDAMPAEAAEPIENPKLIHYNLFAKPWCYDHVQYESYFWKYARHSGYMKEIMNCKELYGEKERQSDRECLELMLERAKAIAAAELNFKSVFNSGREKRL
ncbi:glycosyltransferase family 8 protein [Aminipila luticellarii]|uniref:Glycosyltransferase family 8 protein n=1 Tax=Aminipila luticellarii TaxID=2507160 RepID=A0A410PV02_9FIRM|nr:glycosyltransferase family 8 protein [Aminipila luticellarii]QAT42779.1 glycosyltransferase family 8 protein [Aminipila luticellarii]